MEYIERKNRVNRMSNLDILADSEYEGILYDVLGEHISDEEELDNLFDIGEQERIKAVLNFTTELKHEILMECYATLLDCWKGDDTPQDVFDADGIDMKSAPNYTWA